MKDKDAQPLLWRYAIIHRKRDREFSDDLMAALIAAGYRPSYHLVETDNFGGDYPNESFIATGIRDKETAQVLADAWNKKHSGKEAPRYCSVVTDGYELQPGFEP